MKLTEREPTHAMSIAGQETQIELALSVRALRAHPSGAKMMEPTEPRKVVHRQRNIPWGRKLT